MGLLVVSATACSDDGNNFPVGGGGNDGGFMFVDSTASDSTNLVDAGVDGAIAPIDANEFDGRVCLLTDQRVLNQCATTGAAGLTVRLGTATAVTGADGSFKIVGQSGSGLVWRITGPNIKSSFEVLADYFIPAMTTTMFNAMKTANGVFEVAGEGSMMVFVSRNGQGVLGQTAGSVPAGFFQPFYDNNASMTTWTQTATGNAGAVWIPGLDVGSVTVTAGGVATTAPIFDDAITFANIILPPP